MSSILGLGLKSILVPGSARAEEVTKPAIVWKVVTDKVYQYLQAHPGHKIQIGVTTLTGKSTDAEIDAALQTCLGKDKKTLAKAGEFQKGLDAGKNFKIGDTQISIIKPAAPSKKPAEAKTGKTLGARLKDNGISRNYNQFIEEKELAGEQKTKFDGILEKAANLLEQAGIKNENCEMCRATAFRHLMEISYGEMESNGGKLEEKINAYADWAKFDEASITEMGKSQSSSQDLPAARAAVSRVIRDNLLDFKDVLAEGKRADFAKSVIKLCERLDNGKLGVFKNREEKIKLAYVKTNLGVPERPAEENIESARQDSAAPEISIDASTQEMLTLRMLGIEKREDVEAIVKDKKIELAELKKYNPGVNETLFNAISVGMKDLKGDGVITADDINASNAVIQDVADVYCGGNRSEAIELYRTRSLVMKDIGAIKKAADEMAAKLEWAADKTTGDNILKVTSEPHVKSTMEAFFKTRNIDRSKPLGGNFKLVTYRLAALPEISKWDKETRERILGKYDLPAYEGDLTADGVIAYSKGKKAGATEQAKAGEGKKKAEETKQDKKTETTVANKLKVNKGKVKVGNTEHEIIVKGLGGDGFSVLVNNDGRKIKLFRIDKDEKCVDKTESDYKDLAQLLIDNYNKKA